MQPASNLPAQAKRAGAKFAIINREPTELDWMADAVVHKEIGEVLSVISIN